MIFIDITQDKHYNDRIFCQVLTARMTNRLPEENRND